MLVSHTVTQKHRMLYFLASPAYKAEVRASRATGDASSQGTRYLRGSHLCFSVVVFFPQQIRRFANSQIRIALTLKPRAKFAQLSLHAPSALRAFKSWIPEAWFRKLDRKINLLMVILSSYIGSGAGNLPGTRRRCRMTYCMI